MMDRLRTAWLEAFIELGTGRTPSVSGTERTVAARCIGGGEALAWALHPHGGIHAGRSVNPAGLFSFSFLSPSA